MTRHRILCAWLAAIVGFAPNVKAQSDPLGYRWSTGDTLRYSEMTQGRVEMQMPGGAVLVRSEHDARIAVAVATSDTLVAWYEHLRLLQEGPGPQTQSPVTTQLIGAHFTLAFDSHQPVRTATTPSIPAEIAALTDLTRQFDDFFITLPRIPLKVGVRWVDTVQTDRPGRPTDTFAGRSVRHYEVVRDTTIDREVAFLVAVSQDVTLNATSRVDEQQLTVTSALVGEDRGEAVFIPSEGRLHARTRAGKLAGSLTLVGPGGELTVPQSYEYVSTLGLVP